jgi:uncharacterized membrane protein
MATTITALAILFMSITFLIPKSLLYLVGLEFGISHTCGKYFMHAKCIDKFI